MIVLRDGHGREAICDGSISIGTDGTFTMSGIGSDNLEAAFKGQDYWLSSYPEPNMPHTLLLVCHDVHLFYDDMTRMEKSFLIHGHWRDNAKT